ncbi:MAG: FlgD immunoglobulin-like domain containing protein [Ignavibacteria bacterium]|jgi:tetratricopeptide (TPR) repeat protein
MKKVIIFAYFLLFFQYIKGQDCLDDITSVIYSYSREGMAVQANQNFDSPYLVRWNETKLNGTPIYLGSFDTENYLPFELIGYENEINNLFSQMITSWNNQYSIQMEIDDNEDYILFGFYDDEDFFTDPSSGTVGEAWTQIPIKWNLTTGQYEFSEILDPYDCDSYYYEGFSYINTYNYEWTTSTTPVAGKMMLGTVILHEMGHVLSLGHSNYILGSPRVMDRQCDPSSVIPTLTTCDIYNASYHYQALYDDVTGFSNEIAITSYPAQIDENQQYSLSAEFYQSSEEPTAHVLSWNWIINLYHDDGTYEYVNETFSGSSYWYSCSWTLNTPSLPTGYNWTLNTDGDIAAEIILTVSVAGSSASPDSKVISFSTPFQNVSGTISSNTTWNGYYKVVGDVTVSNGATLTISPNTYVFFSSGTSLIVNGDLNALGESGDMITFASASSTAPSSWGSIELNGSGASGSVISYAKIKYGYEVRVINVPSFEISNCNFVDNYISMYVSGSSGTISDNSLTSSSIGHSIQLDNSTVNCYRNVITKTGSGQNRGSGIQYGGGSGGCVGGNKISYCFWGIGAIWGSSPLSFYSAPNNKITDCTIGLNVYRQSYPVFGYQNTDGYDNNSIYDNTANAKVGIAYSGYASGLYAYNNWWGSYPPNTSLFSVGSEAFFYYSPFLADDPWTSLAKASATGEIAAVELEQPNIQPSEDPDDIFNGIILRTNKKYKEAKEFFMSYLEKYPENQQAYAELYHCYSKETASDLIKYFTTLPDGAIEDNKLFLSYLYLKEEDIQVAKQVNNSIIYESSDMSLVERAKMNNIYIALYNENNFDEAVEMFSNTLTFRTSSKSLISSDISDVENAIEAYALVHGKTMPDFSSLKKYYTEEAEIPEEYGLLGNYPNPFNPSTTISYSLPVESNVKICIYDILGKLVKSFSCHAQPAGYTQVEWNGRNENNTTLASGIYIYRMEAIALDGNGKNFVQSRKMLLLK